jgi:hypothetical protein
MSASCCNSNKIVLILPCAEAWCKGVVANCGEDNEAILPLISNSSERASVSLFPANSNTLEYLYFRLLFRRSFFVSTVDIERGADSTTWPEIVNPDITEKNIVTIHRCCGSLKIVQTKKIVRNGIKTHRQALDLRCSN